MDQQQLRHSLRLAIRAQRQPLLVLGAFGIVGAVGLWLLGRPGYAFLELISFLGFDILNQRTLAELAKRCDTEPVGVGFHQLIWSTGLRHLVILLPALMALLNGGGLGEALYLAFSATSILLMATFQCTFSRALLIGATSAPLVASAAAMAVLWREPFGPAMAAAELVFIGMCVGVSTACTRVRRSLSRREAERAASVKELERSRDEAQEARLRAEHLAFRDSLTGLANRTLFQQKLQSELESEDAVQAGCGLVLLDVDHFKDVNDTLGHDAGDRLLRAIAVRLEGQDDLAVVARLGGDEFAILLPGVSDAAAAMAWAERARESLEDVVLEDDAGVSCSASMGVAFTRETCRPSDLLKNADIALYQAKSAGRSRAVLFGARMKEQVEARVATLQAARIGAELKRFEPWFQPIVSLESDRVEGFEALIRWRQDDGTVLGPDAFLAALEDTELSLRLGELMLDQVLAEMRGWTAEGVAFERVAVNLSPSQFARGDLAAALERKLTGSGVSGRALTVEITESVYLGDRCERVGKTVEALRALGMRIALDDFGTGYAGLSTLRQLPIDVVKIDKSFVQSGDMHLIRLIVDLAKQTGMTVVAEGVERRDQASALADLGCQCAQGFLYSAAMPAKAVPAFVQNLQPSLRRRPTVLPAAA